MLRKNIERVLVSEKQIEDVCIKLGQEITNDYKDKDLVLLGLLKGCMPFMSDLSKHIRLPVEMAYMAVSSYHGTTSSSGEIQINYDLDFSIKNKHVLIVEDIVDTANTITTVINMLENRGATSVDVVTLLDKPEGRIKEFVPKYVGFTIPKEFVVGYGLDYEQRYRNIPYVGILKPKVYTKNIKGE